MPGRQPMVRGLKGPGISTIAGIRLTHHESRLRIEMMNYLKLMVRGLLLERWRLGEALSSLRFTKMLFLEFFLT